MGRKYIGVEINKEYYDDAVKNMEHCSSVMNSSEYEPKDLSPLQKSFLDGE